MDVFGRSYPPALQRSVNHGERLADLLSTPELVSDEEPWALGRPEEIASYIAIVVSDWGAHRKTEAEAAAAIDTYLRELHEGMRRIFGIQQPRCCNTTEGLDEEPAFPTDQQRTAVVITEPLFGVPPPGTKRSG